MRAVSGGVTHLVNEAQRRSIETMMHRLDETLSEFESWAEGRERRGVVYEEKNDLAESQRLQVLAAVSSLRDEVAALRDDLGLETAVKSARASIIVAACSLWESLVDTGPSKLRRYGEVAPELESYLAPRIEKIVEGINRLISLLGTGPA